MSDYIHMRHGEDSQNKELIEMLDLTFDFTQNNDSFINLLPKLYKDKYHPAKNNIILDVQGDMRAAVGLYYNNIEVCGEKLKVGGIGNVAVHPDHRNKGYMQFCMLLALDEMKQNMVDISALGGARQRYEHFSYEPAGIQCAFNYTKNNVKRTLGADRKAKFTAVEIKETDTAIFEEICEIYNRKPFKAERTVDIMFDILKTWKANPYAVFDGDEFKGWFALNADRNYVFEIGYKNEDDIEELILITLETSEQESIKIVTPPFDKPLCRYLGLNCEHYDIGHAEQFTILCYENVLRAFLKLKATYSALPDGELKVFIQGEKLPEQIKITVKDNNVTVEETDEKPDIILKHLEAMRLFGGLYSERRNELSAACQAWFPLPLYSYGLDNV